MGKQRRHRYHRAAPVHKNPNGHWCHCPFGDPRKEKYVSRHMKEFVGSWENTASFTVEAAKYDWLLGRPDVQENPEHKSFVHKLQVMHPEHDPLFPWLLREYKKGRINDSFAGQQATGIDESGNLQPHDAGAYLRFKDHEGRERPLGEDHLEQISDWMKYMKQAKKGVDIMKHEIGDATHQAEKNDEGGETVHNFTEDDDGNRYGHYDDWTIKRLRNKRDMVKEGERMDHCIGGGGRGGYIEKNDEGKAAYYSLRTANNEPVATLEMTPKAEHYYMCPGCSKPAFGTGDVHHHEPGPNGEPGQGAEYLNIKCEHCGTNLAKQTGPYYEKHQEPYENVKQFPVKINNKKPTADHMEAAQLFGHSDKKLDDDHESLVNAWLSKHGHSWVDSDGDEDYEEEEEEYEPWWDSSYDIDGATTMDDFLNWHVSGEYHDYGPEEYDRAVRDAEENGLEAPELNLGEPDIYDIFQDMVSDMAPGTQGQHASQVDPHKIADMFEQMENHGHGDEFRDLAHTWLNDEYNAYLDPYGTAEGPGNFQHHERGIIGPPTPEGKLPQADLTSPGVHYPGKYFPADELFAKNIQYHLDRWRDPQDGIPQSAYNLRYNYPTINPGEKQETPNIPMKEHVPYPEQTGVDIQDPSARSTPEGGNQALRNRPVHLPYGRDAEFGAPTGYGGGDNIAMNDIPGGGGRPSQPDSGSYNQQRPVDALRPHLPGTPEEAFGQEDVNIHQRPLPGIPDAFDPMRMEQFPQMQQQGQLMPQHWYRNMRGGLQLAQLPPELYPPGTLMYERQNPEAPYPYSRTPVYSPEAPAESDPRGTEPMWQKAPVDQESLVNTQTDVGSSAWGDLATNRPIAPWVAKTAGPWTEYEDALKDAPEPHTGVPQLNGRVVETNVSHYQELPMFEWRRPVVYHRGEDKLYVGQPSMDHNDMMKHMGKESPWDKGMPRRGMLPGYIDLTAHLKEGGLHFFQSAQGIPNEDQLHDWVEGRFGVRRPEDTQELTNADWITSHTAAWPDEEEDQFEKEQRMYQERGPLQWEGPNSEMPGKAFLDMDGRLHTWNDDPGSSTWQHSYQAAMRGVNYNPNTCIYMNGDGSVRDEYGLARTYPIDTDLLYDKLKQHHPGTTWPAIDSDQKGAFDDDDLWGDLISSSYHPRQDDEWVAGDEADFSVVVPEARWAS